MRLFLAAAILVVCFLSYVFRDRKKGYALDLTIDGRAATQDPRPLRAGFARVRINPDLNQTNRPVYLAGFDQNRKATRIHDDLWAVAGVVDDGHTRWGLIALDAIGFFHDDVVSVRAQVPADLGVHYTVVCATHNHATPDLMGLWGPSFWRSGVDPAYRELVIAAAVQALRDAVAALEPAELRSYEIPTPPAGLVTDTRKPIVFDSDLRVMLFRRAGAGPAATLGSIVGWGNHPETPWAQNTEITADFPGVLRDSLEKGIVEGDTVKQPGLGGIHLFVNGAVGGLMTTSPSVTVTNTYDDRILHQKPTHEKTRALGQALARRVLERLASATNDAGTAQAALRIRARTLALPVANPAFWLAPTLGLIDRGHVRWGSIRSEVALIQLGEVSMICIPGEIYPELVNGGIERAPGGDFATEPLELPPLRDLMPGRIKFVFGLANDEIGYIIPKSEWDTRAPYIYGAAKPVYGEINSLGPETAPRLHAAIRSLCRE